MDGSDGELTDWSGVVSNPRIDPIVLAKYVLVSSEVVKNEFVLCISSLTVVITDCVFISEGKVTKLELCDVISLFKVVLLAIDSVWLSVDTGLLLDSSDANKFVVCKFVLPLCPVVS